MEFHMKKIVIDCHVPFLDGVFSGFADTVVLPPAGITRDVVRDADALIVRTRTRCDASLLEGSKVTFVGTATIGMDHFDAPWLAANGIEAVNAPGCNAPAVAQYVLASIFKVCPNPEGLTVGIVGVGHVGRIVDAWCRGLGMNTLLCDPPRALAEGPEGFCGLDEVCRRADIITFHTPHTRAPQPFPSHHLADEAFFNALCRRPVIINAARGPVVDNLALLAAMDAGKVGDCVIDCWEGEPSINPVLLERATIATPHIAGYSLQGKQRATQGVVNALFRHFGSDRRIDLGVSDALSAIPAKEAITASYDPTLDMAVMRREMASASMSPRMFEHLRDAYPLRQEVTID